MPARTPDWLNVFIPGPGFVNSKPECSGFLHINEHLLHSIPSAAGKSLCVSQHTSALNPVSVTRLEDLCTGSGAFYVKQQWLVGRSWGGGATATWEMEEAAATWDTIEKSWRCQNKGEDAPKNNLWELSKKAICTLLERTEGEAAPHITLLLFCT